MSKKPFIFKQFEVQQDRCAMKIGTDGVLLGAWADIPENTNSILDIGTGTGVIALMMAQRSSAQLIDALEIDENAYEQAVENFEQSDWGDRLFCYHAEFGEFVEEMQDEEKYDLIISNPPFYNSDYKTTSEERDIARFQDALPFKLLLEGSTYLLSEKGKLAVIIPKNQEENFLDIAKNFGLFPEKITYVKGSPTAEIKRCLILLNINSTKTAKDELIIEHDRHQYTKEYKNLVSPFYLKM
ncbi:tRNA1(Val) (adenine(37)-N6)-methyltransferase [Zunongwangia atlantica]|uniref:tRNA1(Val) (adenine(37)-N6)-methyltransferase n=1 Tax=Zunongwangia atlantica 22II14-10F7 TaxID=1185767 RepID=A0A1Y1T235_9FLAO|nr:methyltransferase [Zunongwangia atlantica]ORL44655.1 methyltransferase small [Zunongwangia atlantica 22II14-10F7]